MMRNLSDRLSVSMTATEQQLAIKKMIDVLEEAREVLKGTPVVDDETGIPTDERMLYENVLEALSSAECLR